MRAVEDELCDFSLVPTFLLGLVGKSSHLWFLSSPLLITLRSLGADDKIVHLGNPGDSA